MDSTPRIRALASEGHAFVVRLRFESTGNTHDLRIRVEDVGAARCWHFTDPAPALNCLHHCIDKAIAGRTG